MKRILLYVFVKVDLVRKKLLLKLFLCVDIVSKKSFFFASDSNVYCIDVLALDVFFSCWDCIRVRKCRDLSKYPVSSLRRPQSKLKPRA